MNAAEKFRWLNVVGNGLMLELRTMVVASDWLTAGDVNESTLRFRGLWDTGASSSAINQRVVDECSLFPIGRTRVQTADGLRDSDVYGINIALPNRVVVTGIRATCGDLGPDTDILIGMDVITTGDLAITSGEGKTLMSFRSPPGQHIDFSKQTVNYAVPKIGRNDLCFCGSGKKFKLCHGK